MPPWKSPPVFFVFPKNEARMGLGRKQNGWRRAAGFFSTGFERPDRGEHLWPCCLRICPHLQSHQCGELCPGRADDAGRLLLLLPGIHLSYSLCSRLSDHPGFFIPLGYSYRNGHPETPGGGARFLGDHGHRRPLHPFKKPGGADLGA